MCTKTEKKKRWEKGELTEEKGMEINEKDIKKWSRSAKARKGKRGFQQKRGGGNDRNGRGKKREGKEGQKWAPGKVVKKTKKNAKKAIEKTGQNAWKKGRIWTQRKKKKQPTTEREKKKSRKKLAGNGGGGQEKGWAFVLGTTHPTGS